ncbi:Pentatricopeptide repeat-containing protein [Capsicum annuum]|nr:Pentatricopeptide repeat-containing protein [Capsicum annuum]KAF3678565.1 Pentatricopeptide repeat-containing protein [Capsicum annuum]
MHFCKFLFPIPLQNSTKTFTSSLSLFSTFLSPSVHQPNEFYLTHQQLPQQTSQVYEFDSVQYRSFIDRAYWTKRIHKLCAIDANVDEALRLLDELRLQGYHPDSLNLSSIVHALCDARRFSEAHQRFLLAVSSHSTVPDERTCNVLIARLLRGGTPEETLRVISALFCQKPQFVPSLMNYNRLIHQFCGFGRTRDAHQLFVDMRKRGHAPNVVSYTTLIDGYCGVGVVREAEKLFDEMSECGVIANALTYSALIRGVLRKRDIEHGKQLIGKLWSVMLAEEDELVNNAAFCNVINCLCREGLFHEVFNIAEDMPQGKSVAGGFVYAQMIDSLCQFGRYNGSARIVYMMRKRGFNPSLVAYNAIVHGLVKEGDCFRAYQLLEEGIQFGYLPSEFTYKLLVESLCHVNDLVKAKEVVNVMLNKNGVDRRRIYNIYLRALCAVDNPTELLNVLVTMLQTQCQPDVITLNTVINGFCKMGRIEEAQKVFKDMMMGKFCAPDGVTFTTVISGFLKLGKVEEALELLHRVMPESGLNPNVVTYNAVIQGLSKLHRIDEAMEVFRSMVSCGIGVDCMTYTIIIDGLFESDKVDEAKRFWNDVVWPSGVHDSYLYAAILKGLCRSGKLHDACDFLYELVDCGVTLCVVNYNIVINGACTLGWKREAYQILGEMRKNGLEPDSVTWRILDKLHGNVEKQFCEDLTCNQQFSHLS